MRQAPKAHSRRRVDHLQAGLYAPIFCASTILTYGHGEGCHQDVSIRRNCAGYYL